MPAAVEETKRSRWQSSGTVPLASLPFHFQFQRSTLLVEVPMHACIHSKTTPNGISIVHRCYNTAPPLYRKLTHTTYFDLNLPDPPNPISIPALAPSASTMA